MLGAVAPAALLTAILVSRTSSENRAVIEGRLLDAVRVDAASLDREFEGSIRALQALATSPALDVDNLEAFYGEARRVQQAQPTWYTVVVLSLDGQQLLNTVRPWGEPLLKAREPASLEQLVAARKPVVGSIRSDPRGGSERRFAVRVPVVRNGRLKYSLTAAIDTALLAPLVRTQLPAAEGWSRSILDAEGAVAVRSRDVDGVAAAPLVPQVLAGLDGNREQVFREAGPDGIEMYAAAKRSEYGWIAMVDVPASVLDAAVRGSTMALLAGGIMLMLCGAVAVVVISRRVSHDLAAARQAAEDLSAGRPIAPMRAHVAEGERLHDALRAAAALLQERARERDREIERAEAEEANRTKDHFLALLGHELRNPLAPAVTALEIIKGRDPNAFPRERKVLERQLAHMVRLVDELLDVSRLARGKMALHLRRFELRDAVDRAVDMARPLIERQAHELHVTVPAAGLPIEADEDRIVQVLTNLLTNAAKFTPPQGHIWLLARAAGQKVVITCEDDGVGVSPELMSALFEPFTQGSPTPDRPFGGLGLGLSLARSLTQLHGGTIEVENRTPERGSRFTVQLPLAAAPIADAPVDVRAQPKAAAMRRILVVDDNADAREMLRAALELAGHTVTAAADGSAALTIAAALQPEVAILDIGMPGMSGYELASRLRLEHPNLRLIAVTGYGQRSDADAALRAGFHVHLVKPVSVEVLLETIDEQHGCAPQVQTGWPN